jgi:hypothetical protein
MSLYCIIFTSVKILILKCVLRLRVMKKTGTAAVARGYLFNSEANGVETNLVVIAGESA